MISCKNEYEKKIEILLGRRNGVKHKERSFNLLLCLESRISFFFSISWFLSNAVKNFIAEEDRFSNLNNSYSTFFLYAYL